MKIRRYKYNSLTFFSIVDDFDCPVDPYVSCYINEALSFGASNTTARYTTELLFILRYFNDLPSRVASGKFITLGEYTKFYEHCFFYQGFQVDESAVLLPSIDDKHLRNAISAGQHGLRKVSSETIQGRIRRLRQFLEWLYECFHAMQVVDKTTENTFQKLILKIKLDEFSFGKNQNHNVADPGDSVVPDEIFLRLLEMILPSSENNPFRSSRARNYLIVSTFIRSGIRRGALAKIKISDCQFHGNFDSISIYKSGDDPSDPRNERPDQKTKSHLSVVGVELLGDIKFYIDHLRSQVPNTQSHDFLFVSEKNSRGTIGCPLSLKSINAIFEKLSMALGFHIHPHLLRKKWNEIFDTEAEARGIDPKVTEDLRKAAMGWSANSSMSELYNERRMHKKIRKLTAAHQERIEKSGG